MGQHAHHIHAHIHPQGNRQPQKPIMQVGGSQTRPPVKRSNVATSQEVDEDDDLELDPVLRHMVKEEDAIFNDPTLRDMVTQSMNQQQVRLTSTFMLFLATRKFLLFTLENTFDFRASQTD